MHEGPPQTPPPIEREKAIPTPDDVKGVFEQLLDGEGYEEVRKLEDGRGLYLWDVKTAGAEYSYMRQGRYKEGEAKNTAIHVTFFDEGGIPIGGHSVAKYENGKWEIVS